MEILERLERRSPVAPPRTHFMALAPLDVWLRMLRRAGFRISPRYWLRLAACLAASGVGTAVTTPERLVLAPVLAGKRRRPPDHPAGVLVVLGYFRTGTTHLQYLLDCDPRFYTPKWHHCLVPQGFHLSWTVLRFLVMPFLSTRRPQDDVSFGPEWPAEDDFGVNNWGLASALPGRFVVPRAYDRFRDYDGLHRLGSAERARWARYQRDFCWKMQRLAGDRALLLKSPAHTGRVPELIDLFGAENLRFVHISRNPESVLRSNVTMLRRLLGFHLQAPVSETEWVERIVGEYDEAERRYLEAKDLIPAGRLAEVRYEDLRADPLGRMRGIYQTLDLDFSADTERAVRAYLAETRDHRPNVHRPLDEEQRAVAARLDWMTEAFPPDAGVGAPERAAAAPEAVAEPKASRARIALALAGTAILCAVAWMAAAYAIGNRMDTLVWPVGIAVGYATLRAAGKGSPGLGLAAAAATLAVLLATAIPNTILIEYPDLTGIHWPSVRSDTWGELRAPATWFWVVMGMLTAYRFASTPRTRRPWRKPPRPGLSDRPTPS